MISLKRFIFLAAASVMVAGCNNSGGGGDSTDDNDGSDGGSGSLSALSAPVFLIGNDGSSGNATEGSQLWKTDGTEANTRLVKDIFPGDDARMRDFTQVGDQLFFVADDGAGHGDQLWVSDGTEAGTRRLTDSTDLDSGLMVALTEFNGKLHFRSRGTGQSAWIWVSDGTPEGTGLMDDTIVLDNGLYPYLHPFDGHLYFAADDGVNNVELWRTDGTAANTELMANIQAGTGLGSLYTCMDGFAERGGWLYFSANDGVDGNSCDLWRTDGTLGNVEKVRDISESTNNGPRRLMVTDNKLYFLEPGSPGVESAIWISDGTEAGTRKIFESNDDYRVLTGSVTEKSGHLMGAGGYAYFYVNDLNESAGLQLWYTDGTDANMLVDLETSSVGDHRIPKAVTNDRLYYIAFRPDGLTRGLWTASGGQTELLSTGDGLGSGTPLLPADDGETLMFRSDLEVWRTDGSDSGTSSVKRICPGPCDGFLGPKPYD